MHFKQKGRSDHGHESSSATRMTSHRCTGTTSTTKCTRPLRPAQTYNQRTPLSIIAKICAAMWRTACSCSGFAKSISVVRVTQQWPTARHISLFNAPCPKQGLGISYSTSELKPLDSRRHLCQAQGKASGRRHMTLIVPEAPAKRDSGSKILQSKFSAPGTQSASPGPVRLVNSERWRALKSGKVGQGPIVYWMSRDQRMQDNWALLHAAEVAATKNVQLAVCFNLMDSLVSEGARQFVFSLRGLRQLAPELEAANIRFYLLRGDPATTVPGLVSSLGAGLLVVDMMPLREQQDANRSVARAVKCPMHEVDAHNVVPVWVTSDVKERSARTIRPKIESQLPKFFEEFPRIPNLKAWADPAPKIDWEGIIADVKERGKLVPELTVFKPGEEAGMDALCGIDGFLAHWRFKKAALEVRRRRAEAPEAVDQFLEELICRRELSENFVFYEPDYDDVASSAPDWALATLRKHEADKREHIYTREQLEAAETHDDIWNAAQLELVHLGKMHCYMRMYWAKKMVEWTPNVEEAVSVGIYLNDKYSIDGRDPNGFQGVMWSMVGLHDGTFTERKITGKIRCMTYFGCQRKFSIPEYISAVQRRVQAEHKAAAAA